MPGASFRSRFGIRAQLIILAVLAMSPFVIDRIRLVEAERQTRIETTAKEALALAHNGLDAQREVVVATRALLQVATRLHETAASSADGCNRLLTTLAQDVPWISGLVIAGANGRVNCSTFANTEGFDISDRPYFQQALSTGDFVLSDYFISRFQRGAAIVAALPLKDQAAKIQSVVVAFIDLHWISRLAANVGERQKSTVLMFDSRGTVLAAYPDPTSLVGKSFADAPLVKVVLDRSEGAVRATGLDGIARVFGFVRLPGTDSHVAVGIDERQVLDNVDRETRIAYVELALVFSLVLCAWFLGVRLIVDPIRSLTYTAKRIGRGQHIPRVADRARIAEFGPLATALEDMADRLAAREDELRAANRNLEVLAQSDGLTGLPNRRSFDSRLREEWARAIEAKHPVTLLMIDVDHFKRFNDDLGHVEGDACLRTVGHVLAHAAEEDGGLVARYGGEEFALLLADVDYDRAIATAERLRRGVESLRIAHPGAPAGRVTVSIGVASVVPTASDPPRKLIERADKALYLAKNLGRNRVMADDGSVMSEAC